MDYQQILEYYLNHAQKTVDTQDNPVVLKTDLFNEARNLPKQGGIIGNLTGCKRIVGVEVDYNTLIGARNNLDRTHLLLHGDIRNLPFPQNTFDVILDFSTIDHIKPSELDKTISDYYTMLMPKGIMTIVTWIGSEKDLEWLPTNQYYFTQEHFEKALYQFAILEKERIHEDNGNELWRYLCSK